MKRLILKMIDESNERRHEVRTSFTIESLDEMTHPGECMLMAAVDLEHQLDEMREDYPLLEQEPRSEI